MKNYSSTYRRYFFRPVCVSLVYKYLADNSHVTNSIFTWSKHVLAICSSQRKTLMLWHFSHHQSSLRNPAIIIRTSACSDRKKVPEYDPNRKWRSCRNEQEAIRNWKPSFFQTERWMRTCRWMSLHWLLLWMSHCNWCLVILTPAVHMPQWETLLNLLAIFIAWSFSGKKKKRTL